MAKRKSARRSATRAATSKAPEPADPTAADAYKAHLRAVSTLLLDALHHVETLREAAHERQINWADVGDMTRAREFTVEAAWALGAITSKEAKAKHGVVL